MESNTRTNQLVKSRCLKCNNKGFLTRRSVIIACYCNEGNQLNIIQDSRNDRVLRKMFNELTPGESITGKTRGNSV